MLVNIKLVVPLMLAILIVAITIGPRLMAQVSYPYRKPLAIFFVSAWVFMINVAFGPFSEVKLFELRLGAIMNISNGVAVFGLVFGVIIVLYQFFMNKTPFRLIDYLRKDS